MSLEYLNSLDFKTMFVCNLTDYEIKRTVLGTTYVDFVEYFYNMGFTFPVCVIGPSTPEKHYICQQCVICRNETIAKMVGYAVFLVVAVGTVWFLLMRYYPHLLVDAPSKEKKK